MKITTTSGTTHEPIPNTMPMIACAACGDAIGIGEPIIVCPDCGAIFCAHCVKDGTFDSHACEDDD